MTAIERKITNDPFNRKDDAEFTLTADKDTFDGPDKVPGSDTGLGVINIEQANSGSLLIPSDAGGLITITYFEEVKLNGSWSRIPCTDDAGNAYTSTVSIAAAGTSVDIPSGLFGRRNLVLQGNAALSSNMRVTLKG